MQSSFLLKPQEWSCGLVLWSMWKRQSLGKCLVLDFCCFHLHLPYCNATGGGGGRAVSFFRRQCAAVSFQFPYARNKSAQCIRPSVLEFPVYKFRITFSANTVSLLLLQSKALRLLPHYLIVSRAVALLWTQNYHAAHWILLFLCSPIQPPS